MPHKDKQERKEYMKKWRKQNPNYDKKRYQNNKEYFVENNRANKKKKKEWIREYKINHPCACGESDPCCLDFHHRDKEDKEDLISRMIQNNLSLERIESEIAKCVIMCSNCHRKLHCSSSR